MSQNKILVTGCAGFIGSNLTDKLLSENHKVIGVDDFNQYYDPRIKEENLKGAVKSNNFKLYREDILNFKGLQKIFKNEKPQKVIHLAARAGVRPSIENPLLYGQVNVLGTVNLLKISVDSGVERFIFGSSSSVYGNSKKLPFREDDFCNEIISPYGASKRGAEFWVESFHKTYGLKCVILRFFTVYGPRGRPDMAPAIFTKAILEGKPVQQFGDGSSSRDYTYINDIVDGIVKVLNRNLELEVINLGNNHPLTLTDFIKFCEKVVGRQAKINKKPSQKGDVKKTWANIVKSKKLLGWAPKTRLSVGLSKYYKWLKRNY